MTNVKTAKVEIAMSVILAQGPCMDMSSAVNLSDSSLQMWSHCFHLHTFWHGCCAQISIANPFGFLWTKVAFG
jgi:hypothetical protein